MSEIEYYVEHRSRTAAESNLSGNESAVGVEIDRLFEEFVGNSRHLFGSYRSLLIERVQVSREVPELEVDIDAGLRTLTQRDRHLLVTGSAVADGVDVFDGRPTVVADLDPAVIIDITTEFPSEAVGYPIPGVEAAGGVITDTVGELDIVVFLVDGELHAFENPGFEFESRDDEFYADDTSWDGITGESADGRQLERLPARRLFAFAWQDGHGPDSFY